MDKALTPVIETSDEIDCAFNWSDPDQRYQAMKSIAEAMNSAESVTVTKEGNRVTFNAYWTKIVLK